MPIGRGPLPFTGNGQITLPDQCAELYAAQDLRYLSGDNYSDRSAGESAEGTAPPLLSEPGVNPSTHRAPIASTENAPCAHQYANKLGYFRFTRASQANALVL